MIPDPKRILLIEDMESEAKVIQLQYHIFRTFLHGDILFDVVRSWGEAEMMITERRPDVIIADLNTLDTTTESAKLRMRVHCPEWPPLIALTGDDSRKRELRMECIAAGAQDFMLKDDARRNPEWLCDKVLACHFRRLIRDRERMAA